MRGRKSARQNFVIFSDDLAGDKEYRPLPNHSLQAVSKTRHPPRQTPFPFVMPMRQSVTPSREISIEKSIKSIFMKKIFTLLFLFASFLSYSQSTTVVISQIYGGGGASTSTTTSSPFSTAPSSAPSATMATPIIITKYPTRNSSVDTGTSISSSIPNARASRPSREMPGSRIPVSPCRR